MAAGWTPLHCDGSADVEMVLLGGWWLSEATHSFLLE